MISTEQGLRDSLTILREGGGMTTDEFRDATVTHAGIVIVKRYAFDMP
jgi:hypothetical protein